MLSRSAGMRAMADENEKYGTILGRAKPDEVLGPLYEPRGGAYTPDETSVYARYIARDPRLLSDDARPLDTRDINAFSRASRGLPDYLLSAGRALRGVEWPNPIADILGPGPTPPPGVKLPPLPSGAETMAHGLDSAAYWLMGAPRPEDTLSPPGAFLGVGPPGALGVNAAFRLKRPPKPDEVPFATRLAEHLDQLRSEGASELQLKAAEKGMKIDEYVRLYREGHKVADIGEMMGMARELRTDYLEAGGISPGEMRGRGYDIARAREMFWAENDAKLREMATSPERPPVKVMARELGGISDGAVQQRLQELGLTKGDVLRLAPPGGISPGEMRGRGYSIARGAREMFWAENDAKLREMATSPERPPVKVMARELGGISDGAVQQRLQELGLTKGDVLRLAPPPPPPTERLPGIATTFGEKIKAMREGDMPKSYADIAKALSTKERPLDADDIRAAIQTLRRRGEEVATFVPGHPPSPVTLTHGDRIAELRNTPMSMSKVQQSLKDEGVSLTMAQIKRAMDRMRAQGADILAGKSEPGGGARFSQEWLDKYGPRIAELREQQTPIRAVAQRLSTPERPVSLGRVQRAMKHLGIKSESNPLPGILLSHQPDELNLPDYMPLPWERE